MSLVRAVILAAGEGTRMKSELPKVLHPICGRPMVAYALHLAAAAGVKQPIVVIGHGAEAVKAVLPKEVKVVVQSKQQGTGDAVLAIKRSLGGLGGDLLILYADTPLLRRTTVQHLIESHRKNNATCTLLTTHLADPSGYGRIVREPAGQIIGVLEESEANASQRAIREINVGPLICKTQALFDALAVVKPTGSKQELFLTHVIAHLARQEGAKIHSIRVEETSEALGINSRAELARAIAIVRERLTETHLRNGVTIEDPQSTYIEQGVTIGVDTIIRPFTVIETGVAIGRRCRVGPFARLRSGVAIGDGARIGNFAELVRTKVGSDVRINHVSYLGDATVEEGANIGAGTITANYDSTAKHPTRIGKKAFIGCDTILIAPVSVGPGAVTGAGSVLTRTHDVPANTLVMGVPARPAPAGRGGTRPAATNKSRTRLAAAPSKDGSSGRAAARVDGRPRGADMPSRRRVSSVTAAKPSRRRPAKPARPSRPRRVAGRGRMAKPPAKKARPVRRAARRPVRKRLARAKSRR